MLKHVWWHKGLPLLVFGSDSLLPTLSQGNPPTLYDVYYYHPAFPPPSSLNDGGQPLSLTAHVAHSGFLRWWVGGKSAAPPPPGISLAIHSPFFVHFSCHTTPDFNEKAVQNSDYFGQI